jgi:ribosome-binding protein aMBF1 (putative translation factor)
MSKLKSFSDARKAFIINLNALMTQFNYTATTFSMRLNQSAMSSGSTKNVAFAEDVAAWLSGNKIPTVYALYKVCQFFNVSIDSLFSSDPIQMTTVTGKSFAKQTAASPKMTITNTTTTTQGNTMTSKKTPITNAKMRELIKTRTTSTDYNLNLAYRILNSDMQLKDIAAKVGVSTRSLRDYAYYGTSVDADVAKQLATVLRTNTTSLGLKLNKETMRYESVK